MERIKIENWEEFQHYKHRNPAWIKLHGALLSNYEYRTLKDGEKLLLLSLWMLRSRISHDIPNDPAYIGEITAIKGKPKLQALIDKGFVTCYQDASSMLSIEKRSAKKQCAPVEKSREEKSRVEERIYMSENDSPENEEKGSEGLTLVEEFESGWDQYPGNKRGMSTELEYFKKKHSDWKDVVGGLSFAVSLEIMQREADSKAKQFVPPWKHFKTWIGNRCWEAPLERNRKESRLDGRPGE